MNRWIIQGWLALCGFSFGVMFVSAQNEAGTPAIPAIRMPVCATAPTIDGILTDACWRTAAVITNFSVFTKPDARRPVRVWITHDDEWLYLAFETTHPFPREIKKTVRQHGGVLLCQPPIPSLAHFPRLMAS